MSNAKNLTKIRIERRGRYMKFEHARKLLSWIFALTCVCFFVGVIFSFVKDKERNLDSSNFKVEILSKENVSDTYSYSFRYKYKITNNGKYMMQRMEGNVQIYDRDGNCLSSHSVTFYADPLLPDWSHLCKFFLPFHLRNNIRNCTVPIQPVSYP